MKQTTTTKNGGRTKQTVSAVLLGASLIFSSPLLDGCKCPPPPPPNPRCDTDLSMIGAQRYHNALSLLGVSPANATELWKAEFDCPPYRFAKTPYAASLIRHSLASIAEACCYEFDIKRDGFNRLKGLVYYDGRPGTIEFSVPVHTRSEERRKRGMDQLLGGLNSGIEAFNTSGSDVTMRLDSISLDGDAIHVKAVAEPRGTVAKQ